MSPALQPAIEDPRGLPLMGLAALTTTAFQWTALGEIEFGLASRLLHNPLDAEAPMDLSTLCLLPGKGHAHVIFQNQALALERVFRQPNGSAPKAGHVLAV